MEIFVQIDEKTNLLLEKIREIAPAPDTVIIGSALLHLLISGMKKE